MNEYTYLTMSRMRAIFLSQTVVYYGGCSELLVSLGGTIISIPIMKEAGSLCLQ